MTFTYQLANLATDEATQIRFRIGDHIENSHLLEDEEIAFELTRATGAAAILASAKRALAAVGRDTDTSGAGINTTRSQRFTQLKDLIRELESGADCAVVLTGDSLSEISSRADDSDKVQPRVSIGMDANPAAGT